MSTDTKKIMWLASFPKSGNTWMRAFLANYLVEHDGDGPLPFKELVKISRGDSNIKDIARVSGSDPETLSLMETMRARAKYLAEVASRPTPTFLKTHSANIETDGLAIIPAELTKCAIYIVRNPLDMVLSYADHMNLSLEEAVKALADTRNRIGMNKKQVLQFMGHWSMHVRSWLGAEGFPAVILRYEDMLDDPEKSFTEVIKMIGAPLRPDKLAHAIEVTRFDSLSRLEKQDGFAERVDGQEKFFRKGTKGHWKDELPGEIVDQIIADHGKVMKFLKYI